MRKRLLLYALILAWAFLWWSHRSIGREPGVLTPGDPKQVRLAGFDQFYRAGHKITPLARFELEARVLGVKRYRFDRQARLAPFDLALGWGRMSDSKVLEAIDVTQAGRFYHWRTERYPIPREEIIRSSSNMHIIPADAGVRGKLSGVRRGHVVSLKGYLVMAEHEDGGVWVSSTTRTDSGDGACEVVWVESLDYR